LDTISVLQPIVLKKYNSVIDLYRPLKNNETIESYHVDKKIETQQSASIKIQ